MSEQVLDVKGAIRLIRRFWVLVLAFVVAGVAAAAAYELITVPSFSATSVVLLPGPASSTNSTSAAARSVTTEAKIATSAAVLVPAGHEADPALSLRALQQRVTTASAATSVLRITATGASRHQAEALANAVAGQLVTFVASSGVTASSGVVAGLRTETKQVGAQIADVRQELVAANARAAADRPTSTAGRASAQLAAALSSQESSLVLQQNGIKSQISQAQQQIVAANEGTQVIQRATSATPPSKSALVLPVLLGALGGLLVGSLLVLAWQRKDPRVWTRNAMAEAVGAPVLASFHVRNHRSPADWADLLEHYEPSALERWSVRRMLRELSGGDGAVSSLSVLAFGRDGGGIAQAVHMGLAAAGSGVSTSLSIVSVGDLGAALRAVCARFDQAHGSPRPLLQIATGPDERAESRAELEISIVLLATPPSVPPLAGPEPHVTVLSTSSGFASAEQLAAVASGAIDRGSVISGVLLANPLTGDHTVGRFVDPPAPPVQSARRHAGVLSSASTPIGRGESQMTRRPATTTIGSEPVLTTRSPA